ncbi:hypothetical protein M2475_001977 [Breznakia sp. PF5-3]|uniref:hypothetical protein n=1 Tax=unclassified Breznakia TaxID=2623764 RepID=UPI0024063C09|nr:MULTISPECIES: hypothetical protein [unclassified Breznakia]MDF9825530.1 hypothetical protein [Breznakia sp. PM6-1]MDF9836397.1 hypothetical protein [Breznakia sp. PF5-3]MDF9838954.1 hypothetical protein [Breznakia sp. PFB2-8]MDF9860549.1 hypothetical protein [Breznakia sp. PH5-24]
MGPYNEFAIIDHLELEYDYSFTDKDKYNYVKISDDFVNEWVSNLKKMPTFWHNLNRPNEGLARYGVTLIPPKSLLEFLNVVIKDENRSEVKKLIELIEEAIKEKKYIIHFGI